MNKKIKYCKNCLVNNKKDLVKNRKFICNDNIFVIIKILLSLLLVTFAYLINNKIIFYSFNILSYIIISYNFLIEVLKQAIKKEFFTEDFLMVLASLVSLFLGEFYESVIILSLFSIGELFEKIATKKSENLIANLTDFKKEKVKLNQDGKICLVSPETVGIGSKMELAKGDCLQIDGILLSDSGYFDTKAITGESKIYNLQKGDRVYSGYINLGEIVEIESNCIYQNSTKEMLLKKVLGEKSKKAKSENFITTFSKIYTPIVIILALIVALVPPFFDNYLFSVWIYKSLSFLVISCPCALAISVPLAYVIGLGNLSKKGIMVKGSKNLDNLCRIKNVYFDKTGTLTYGKLKIVKVVSFNSFDEAKAVSYAKAIENFSSHPISEAFKEYNKIEKEENYKVNSVKEFIGKGISGIICGDKITLGNEKIAKEIKINSEDNKLLKYQMSILMPYQEIVIMLKNDLLIAIFILEDTLKIESKQAIHYLKKCGIKQINIISGDNFENVKFIKDEIFADNFKSELLPEEKLNEISSIDSIYIGDGVNDGPALAKAKVGIAMGKIGSQLAIETADVVILDDDLLKIPYLIKISKKVKLKVIENISVPLILKFCVMLLSFFITLPVWLVMFSDVGLLIFAIINALAISPYSKKIYNKNFKYILKKS